MLETVFVDMAKSCQDAVKQTGAGDSLCHHGKVRSHLAKAKGLLLLVLVSPQIFLNYMSCTCATTYFANDLIFKGSMEGCSITILESA